MKYLDYEGLSYLWNKIKSYITSKHFAGSTIDGGPANKAVSILFGQVDSTSTSTAFTATVDGITELRDGVCVYLRNGVVTSAAGYTIDINGLGAKPVYTTMSDASASSTQFNVNYTMLFVYNSTRVSGGCWDMFYGYNSNDNSIGYNIQDYAIRKPVKNVLYKYQFLFTCMDGTLLPPNSDSNVITATHVLTKESFNPFGQVYYYGATTTVNAGSTPAAGTLFSQATYSGYADLRYSFNTAASLVANNDIYIKCIPQPDGSAILADDAIVFALPTYEDGFIYKRLGKAYDTYRIILEQDKPVYYFHDGAVKLWAGPNLADGIPVTDEFTKKDSGVTSDVRVKSVGGKTVVWNQQTSDDVSHWHTVSTTLAKEDDVLVLTRNSTNAINVAYNTDIVANTTHKYYIACSAKTDGNHIAALGFHSKNYTINGNSILEFNTTTFERESVIATPVAATDKLCLRCGVTATASDVSAYFKDVMCLDLTQMFGTGNEPSTVEEFEAMFPEDSYAYDAGRIVNVAMTGMKSLDAEGNNLDSANFDVSALTGKASLNVLPAGYVELEYLQSSGTQYIDTGKVFNSAYSYKFKYKRTTADSTPFAGYRDNSSASTGANCSFTWSGSNYDVLYFANSVSSSSASFNWERNTNAHIVELDAHNAIFTVDGTSKIVYSLLTSLVSTKNFYLFNDNRDSMKTGMTGNFYYYEVWNGDTLVQKLVPAKRLSDDELGMYDLVSGTFLTNVGTGTFTAGPVIVSETIFPNGMNGIGDVRDEIDLVNGRAVKRIGVVDMGTLTWESLGNNAFSSSNIDGLKIVLTAARDALKLCLKYPQSGARRVSTTMDDKTMNNRANQSPKVVVKDTTYSNVTTFATAMQGVLLYYELATPIEYTLDDVPSCVMSVVKGGKEMILPYNASEPQCAPARIVEEYKMEYVSNKVVKSLEDRIAALEVIINNG